MSFEEWRSEQRLKINGYTERDAYNAGAQSRQAEIDELKWMLKNANGQADDFCKESIELQKRIDVLTTKVNEMAHIFLDDLEEILKGETNE